MIGAIGGKSEKWDDACGMATDASGNRPIRSQAKVVDFWLNRPDRSVVLCLMRVTQSLVY